MRRRRLQKREKWDKNLEKRKENEGEGKGESIWSNRSGDDTKGDYGNYRDGAKVS